MLRANRIGFGRWFLLSEHPQLRSLLHFGQICRNIESRTWIHTFDETLNLDIWSCNSARAFCQPILCWTILVGSPYPWEASNTRGPRLIESAQCWIVLSHHQLHRLASFTRATLNLHHRRNWFEIEARLLLDFRSFFQSALMVLCHLKSSLLKVWVIEFLHTFDHFLSLFSAYWWSWGHALEPSFPYQELSAEANFFHLLSLPQLARFKRNIWLITTIAECTVLLQTMAVTVNDCLEVFGWHPLLLIVISGETLDKFFYIKWLQRGLGLWLDLTLHSFEFCFWRDRWNFECVLGIFSKKVRAQHHGWFSPLASKDALLWFAIEHLESTFWPIETRLV